MRRAATHNIPSVPSESQESPPPSPTHHLRRLRSHPPDMDLVKPLKPQSRFNSTTHFNPSSPFLFPFPSSSSSSSSLLIPSIGNQNRPSRRLGCLCTVVFFIFGFAFYLVSLSRGVQFSIRFQKAKNKGYTVVIDGGSSGSRLHVFQYVNEGPLPVVGLTGRDGWSLKTKPGLSSFALDPSRAGESLKDLLDFAREKVPKKERSSTKVYLMATAGLRRLDVTTQKAILQSCRVVLRASGFLFRDDWASVISGVDEGVYAWVAANYALGTLGRNPLDSAGIIELGGASAQVTFVPEKSPPPEFLTSLELGGVTYMLYTHSFLNFGQEAAWDTLLELLLSGSIKPSFASAESGVVVDPCTPKGFQMSSDDLAKHSVGLPDIVGVMSPSLLPTGNFSECRKAALKLLQKDQAVCIYPKCAVGSTFVPELRGKFFATENFFYTSQFFGLEPTASLRDIEDAGQRFCEEDWSNLQEKHKTIDKEDLLKYCFSSAYIVALLHDSLGVAMRDDRVWFTNEVGKVSLDWALGALIVKMGQDDPPADSTWTLEKDYRSFFYFSGVFLLLGLLFIIFSRWQGSHTKTIYDLEKGRYITTISRNKSKKKMAMHALPLPCFFSTWHAFDIVIVGDGICPA